MQLSDAQRNKWLFCLGVSFCALVLMVAPDALIDFRYERAALLSGEWWRFFTGHLVHLNFTHLALNLFGLFLVCELLWHGLPWAHGCALLFFSALGTSALFWWLHPELAWYAGLSGVLHGLWAGCALSGLWPAHICGGAAPVESALKKKRSVQMFPASSRYFFIWALMLLALKLGLEAVNGPSPHTEQMIGGTVVSIAHLYGALSGITYISIWRCISRYARVK